MALHIFQPERIIAQVGDLWVEAALEAIRRHAKFNIALSGGNTPARLYRRLASDPRLNDCWPAVRLWFGDERCVPPGHPDSNYRMVRQAGLTPGLGLTLERMEGELDPELAAVRYAERLRALPQQDGWPQFDLVMLGMGEDGHIASLFPGSANFVEREKWVSAAFVERLGAWRLSLTLPVIAAARQVLVLVTGANKARVLADVLRDSNPTYPASAIARLAQATWLLDEAAASGLDS